MSDQPTVSCAGCGRTVLLAQTSERSVILFDLEAADMAYTPTLADDGEIVWTFKPTRKEHECRQQQR